MSDSSKTDDCAFAREEWVRVHERRAKAFRVAPADDEPSKPISEPQDLVGLSLSGGGLRSAMFNDGFLQGLSHSGLLRYVDYLCSVSGGGYIAGHLATRAKKKSKTGFHDDDGNESSDPRWSLGRSPATGEVNQRRLRGVGRYLASKVALAPSFLWSLLLSAMVYIGLVGVVATIMALFWRTFDDPTFRVLLRGVLDFKFGGELAIAFYPAMLVLLIWMLLWVFGWFRSAQNQQAINRTGMMIFAAAVCISIAVFIGNGKTSASRNGTASLQLNHYAQWLAIFAGGLQLLAFVGRDKLFRSERDESHYWQKALQKFATTGVILFASFAMVHFMAREDISGYTSQRSPHLVRGDVQNWDMLQRISGSYGQWKSQGNEPIIFTDPNTNIDGSVEIDGSGINLADKWAQHQKVNPLITLTDDVWTHVDSAPPSPDEPCTDQIEKQPSWTFWPRMVGAVQAYGYSLQTPSKTEIAAFKASFAKTQKLVTIRDYYLLTHLRFEEQSNFLEKFNPSLEEVRFSAFLRRIANQNDIELDDEAKATSIALRRFPVVDRGTNEAATANRLKYRRAIAADNRQLLMAVFPNLVQDANIPSTLVVPPYDQAARQRWLLAWWTLFCVGIVLSAFRNQSSTIYTYYRDRLSKLFLDRDAGSTSGSYDGTTPLHELRPTADGLPHPLFLAARMTPSVVEDSYSVLNEPFLFSPIYCGDGDKKPFATSEVGLPGVGNRPVQIGDAVTLSGAAVTPFMTENRALSIVISFFGDGLGQWLIRRDPRQRGRGIASVRTPVAGTIACALLIAGLTIGWFHFGFGFSAVMIFVLSVAATCVAANDQSGISKFLAQMFRPVRVSKVKKFGVETPTAIGHVADGGFYDYLGVSELFRRKCSLIVVSDAGANLGNNPLGPLAKMCTSATENYGVRILDLDHESPIDFGRLEIDQTVASERVVHQPYLAARLRYADGSEGLLVYCQMAITHSDPIEIQQIRNRFPSFPDEPTTNQFYTDDQVAAYRNLGHHIATRMCSELQRWKSQDLPEVDSTQRQPMFDVVRRRLLTAYRLACYQEHTYKSDDLFSEAIWSVKLSRCPAFARIVKRNLLAPGDSDSESLAEIWLRAYENNADVRAKYRHAILGDVNSIEDDVVSHCADICQEILRIKDSYRNELVIDPRGLMSAHLAAIAVACHEIHEGRPNAIFQVGGREKLLAMTSELSHVLIENGQPATEFGAVVTTPRDEAELRMLVKKCIGEILELEKCTFQNSERVTAVSFAQCLVMMWGKLSKRQAEEKTKSKTLAQKRRAEKTRTAKPFRTIAEQIRKEGIELASSRVRIWLERGLRTKNLTSVINGLQKAWAITYLPASMLAADLAEPNDDKQTGATIKRAAAKKRATAKSAAQSSQPNADDESPAPPVAVTTKAKAAEKKTAKRTVQKPR